MGRRSGKYYKEFVFTRRVATGQGVTEGESWVALVTLRGKRMYPQGGSGKWNHSENQDLPDDTQLFECRYYDGLSTVTDRFLVDGVYYELLDVQPLERKEGLRLVAKKRVDA